MRDIHVVLGAARNILLLRSSHGMPGFGIASPPHFKCCNSIINSKYSDALLHTLFGKPQTLFVAAAQDSGILIVLSFDSFFADPGSKLPGWIQSMKSMHGSTDSKQHRLTRNQPLQATLVPMRPSQLRPRSQLHQPPLQPPLSSCHLCMRRLSKCWSRNSRKKRCWCSTGHSQRVEESLRPYSPCHSSTAGLTGDCPHSLNRPCRALAGGSTATQCCRKVFVSRF